MYFRKLLICITKKQQTSSQNSSINFSIPKIAKLHNKTFPQKLVKISTTFIHYCMLSMYKSVNTAKVNNSYIVKNNNVAINSLYLTVPATFV